MFCRVHEETAEDLDGAVGGTKSSCAGSFAILPTPLNCLCLIGSLKYFQILPASNLIDS